MRLEPECQIMLYLEDYLEMIEQLHHDLKDQFTAMREMDLAVQNDHDKVKQDIFIFCQKAKTMSREEWKEEQIPILNSFKKIMETADDKVQLSTSLHDSVNRYYERLDKELAKFKSELESDNEGITEILEQIAMVEEPEIEPEASPTLNQSVKGLKKKSVFDPAPLDNSSDYDVEGPGLEGLDDYGMLGVYDDLNPHGSPGSVASDMSSDLLGHIRKRKREEPPSTLNLSSASNYMPGLDRDRGLTPMLKKKKQMPMSSQGRLNKKLEYQSSQEVFDVDWQYVDPNEPRYCICEQVSYGDMVGCDNPSCPIEWFHYGCVGLTDAPKGKWFCPQCSDSIRKKK